MRYSIPQSLRTPTTPPCQPQRQQLIGTGHFLKAVALSWLKIKGLCNCHSSKYPRSFTMAFIATALDLQSAILIPSILLSFAVLIYLRYFYNDFPAIQGIPEIPGASLLHGHLYQLGHDHATTAQEWAEKYGWPIFQIRLGNRRVVVLNGFEMARDWIVTNQASTVDRPLFYTFHGVVSKTSGQFDAFFFSLLLISKK